MSKILVPTLKDYVNNLLERSEKIKKERRNLKLFHSFTRTHTHVYTQFF